MPSPGMTAILCVATDILRRVSAQRFYAITGRHVVELLRLFVAHGIDVWVDPKLRALLEARGYRDVPRPDTRDCNFVLGDDEGREVDVHSYTFDESGRHVFGCEYPAESLTG